MSRPPSGRARAVSVARVGAGDAADNGQAEPVSVDVADSLGAELLERLEKAVNLIGRDHCPGVADRNARPSGGRCRRDLNVAAGHVVAQGVVHQVCDQAFGQARVTRCRGGGERRADDDASPLGFLAADHDYAVGDLGEVKGFPLLDSPFATGQGE